MADPRQSLVQDESQNRPLGPDPPNPHAENFKWLNRAHRGKFYTAPSLLLSPVKNLIFAVRTDLYKLLSILASPILLLRMG